MHVSSCLNLNLLSRGLSVKSVVELCDMAETGDANSSILSDDFLRCLASSMRFCSRSILDSRVAT